MHIVHLANQAKMEDLYKSCLQLKLLLDLTRSPFATHRVQWPILHLHLFVHYLYFIRSLDQDLVLKVPYVTLIFQVS